MDGRERGVEVWVGLWVVLWGGGGLGQRMDDIMSRPLLCATVPRAHLLWRWWSGWHNSSRFLWPFRFPLLRFVVAVVAVVAVVVGSWHGSAVIYRRFQSDVAVGPVSFASVAPASSICCCCCCCCCCWSCVLVRFEIFHSCSTCSGCLLEPMFFFSVDAPDIVGTWMRCWWWRTWKMGKRIKRREREKEREWGGEWAGRAVALGGIPGIVASLSKNRFFLLWFTSRWRALLSFRELRSASRHQIPRPRYDVNGRRAVARPSIRGSIRLKTR